MQVTTPDEVTGGSCASRFARGVDIIKLGIIDSREFPLRGYLPILEAAINEGHQLGVRVAVHAEELKAAKAAVRAGADLLAHTVKRPASR